MTGAMEPRDEGAVDMEVDSRNQEVGESVKTREYICIFIWLKHCRDTDATNTACGKVGGRLIDPLCNHCEEPEDTVENTLFDCPY